MVSTLIIGSSRGSGLGITEKLLKENHEVHYTRNTEDKEIVDSDFVILPTSIIAHETEILALNRLENKKIEEEGGH